MTGETKRYKLCLEFDGAPFRGWQLQEESFEKSSRPSVQGEIEKALGIFFASKERIVVQGCGRTDSGVHALEFYCHFDLPKGAPLESADRLRHGLNGILPGSLCVSAAQEVSGDFHALASVKKKQYLYRLLLRRARAPIDEGRVWRLAVCPKQQEGQFDLEALREALGLMQGEHDFAQLASAHCQVKTTTRNLDVAHLELSDYRSGDESRGTLLEFRFEARGFLRYQVRNMVGAAVQVAQSQISLSELESLLSGCSTKNQVQGGLLCAPAHGLYLERVYYG